MRNLISVPEQPLPKEATTVFEEILGIPAHPLLVHGAVVFVPLLVLGAIAYAAAPFTRRYVWWAVLALAVIAPAAAWSAKLSGQAFRARLARNGAGADFLATIDEHSNFGTMTAYFSTGLGVLMLLVVLILAKRPVEGADGTAAVSPVLTIVSAVVVIAVSAATGYYVFKTGDSGAHIVWSGQ